MMKTRESQAGAARSIFVLAVSLSAAVLLALSFVRGQSLVDMLARVITKFVVPANTLIMFFFAVIVALVVGVFLHYYLFELKPRFVYDASQARRLSQTLHAADRPPAERLSAMRAQLEQDETLFGQILRRFLHEKGFSSERPGKVWQAIQDEEFDRVKRNIMYFSLASVISPAIGFLGTAIGMVSAFYEISIADTVTPATLAMSIQIALITTVIGLVIKTISMMLKTMVIHSIGRREDDMTLAFQRLFER